MDKAQYMIFAVFVGVQSLLLQLADRFIGTHLVPGGHSGFVFIAFQGWALYFLLGSSVKGAVKAFCGYVMGIVFAVIMMGLASAFPWMGILAIPVTAFLVVPFMMYFEFAPWCISNVAVFFVGAGAFYGINSYVDGIRIWQSAGIVLLYCVFGLVCGWMTILFRSRYEKILADKNSRIDEKKQKTGGMEVCPKHE